MHIIFHVAIFCVGLLWPLTFANKIDLHSLIFNEQCIIQHKNKIICFEKKHLPCTLLEPPLQSKVIQIPIEQKIYL